MTSVLARSYTHMYFATLTQSFANYSQELHTEDQREKTLREQRKSDDGTIDNDNSVDIVKGKSLIWHTLQGPGKIEKIRLWTCTNESAGKRSLKYNEKEGSSRIQVKFRRSCFHV